MGITPVARLAAAAGLVLSARGTGEPVGVGQTGQAFVDALRAQVPNRSIGVYAVDYLASDKFDNRMEFAGSVVDGIRDAGAHIQATATNCPNTRIVLGGPTAPRRW